VGVLPIILGEMEISVTCDDAMLAAACEVAVHVLCERACGSRDWIGRSMAFSDWDTDERKLAEADRVIRDGDRPEQTYFFANSLISIHQSQRTNLLIHHAPRRGRCHRPCVTLPHHLLISSLHAALASANYAVRHEVARDQ
jgi:hypothetical protein